MRRPLAVLASVACALGFMAAPASPAAADTATAGQPTWSVALTFPDMQWSSHSCQFLPVSAVVTGDVQSWTFGGFVNLVQADDPDYSDYSDEDFYTWYIDYDDMVRDGTGTFSFRHAVMLCPGSSDPSGKYSVDGEIGVRTAASTEWVWLPYRATFTVSGIPTTTTLDSIEVASGMAVFAGRITVNQAMPATFPGCQAAVTIEQDAGSGWEHVWSEGTAQDGSFALMVPTARLTGTQYRASLRPGHPICGPSSSQPRALPVKLPSVALTTVSRDSKLRVDIDPNLGRKSWLFRIERERSDDWRKVGSYRTQGSRELRTINLPQGCYRVRVPAQRGYAEYLSDSVCLAR